MCGSVRTVPTCAGSAVGRVDDSGIPVLLEAQLDGEGVQDREGVEVKILRCAGGQGFRSVKRDFNFRRNQYAIWCTPSRGLLYRHFTMQRGPVRLAVMRRTGCMGSLSLRCLF